jgi:hypothetical protein
VHKSKVTRRTYNTQVKINKVNVQYTSQVRSSCYLWLVYCTFVLLLLTCVLYVHLVDFDLCIVRSSCYLWLVYCTFTLLILTCVLYVRLVTFDLCTVRSSYNTQVKINKVNVQYTSQKQQAERTVHKSKATSWTHSKQVKSNKTNVQYTQLVTYDLCTVRSPC